MKTGFKFNTNLALILIFFLSFGFQVYHTFQAEGFSDSSSYYQLRQVESIKERGIPFFNDPLRSVDESLVAPSLFHYILAAVSLVIPLEIAAKILPALFMAMNTIVVYLIAREVTGNQNAAIFAAVMSAFIPVAFGLTLNKVGVLSLMVPYLLFMIYCLMRVYREAYLYAYLLMLFVLPLIHASGIILVLIFLFYVFLMKIEHLRKSRYEVELIILSTMYIVWLIFLMYKNAFLEHGPFIIWQNIPRIILSDFFSKVTLLDAIIKIGLLPFMLGLYVIYKSLFKEKNKKIYLLISFCMGLSVLLWLRLIELNIGATYLALIVCILSAKFYDSFFLYLEKTSFSSLYPAFIFILFILIFLTSLIPSLAEAENIVKGALTEEEESALLWIKQNVPDDAVFLSTTYEGKLLIGLAGKKAIIDDSFLLRKDPDNLMEDIKTLYSTDFQTVAIRLLESYGIDYIYLTPRAKEEYGEDGPGYVTNERCFNPLYNQDGITVYHSICTID